MQQKKKVPFGKFDFLKNRKLFAGISAIIIIIGIVTISFCGMNLGIDYRSGTDITISTEDKITKKQLNKDLKALKLKSSDITIGTDETFIRIDDALSGEAVKEVNTYFEDKVRNIINESVNNR